MIFPLLLFLLSVKHPLRCFAQEEKRDWFGECKVVSCSLKKQACELSSTETRFFHNGGLFYCPPGGEYDYLTWDFDCRESVVLLPTAEEHRTITGVSSDDLDIQLFRRGVRSVSMRNVAILIEPNGFHPPSRSTLVPLYRGADAQIDKFLVCNGEKLELNARDKDGQKLNLTIEGPLPRYDDSIVESCYANNSTCEDGFLCATCNADKSVDLVRLVGYENTTNRLIEASVSRAKRGSGCPVDPAIVYGKDFGYKFEAIEINAFGSARLSDVFASSSHGEGFLKNSNSIFTCSSSPNKPESPATATPTAPAENRPTLPDQDNDNGNDDTSTETTPTRAPQPGNSSTSPAASPAAEEVCLELSWLKSVGLREEQMLHEKSIRSRILCPGLGVPCGTPDHLLLKEGSLISYADICKTKKCESRVTLVNSAKHRHLLQTAIHLKEFSVTACSGKPGSWQRWVEEIIVRHVYIAHRAWST